LWQSVDVLTFDFPLFKEKVLFNKARRGVSITHMEKAFIPREYGMEMMGYRNPISYGILFFSTFFFSLFIYLFISFVFCIFSFIYLSVCLLIHVKGRKLF
jgi:hypothetical protein